MLPTFQHDQTIQGVSAKPDEASNAGILRHSKVHDKSNPHRQRDIIADGRHQLKPPVISIKDGNAVLFTDPFARNLRNRNFFVSP